MRSANYACDFFFRPAYAGSLATKLQRQSGRTFVVYCSAQDTKANRCIPSKPDEAERTVMTMVANKRGQQLN